MLTANAEHSTTYTISDRVIARIFESSLWKITKCHVNSDNSLNARIYFIDNPKIQLKFDGTCFKQQN